MTRRVTLAQTKFVLSTGDYGSFAAPFEWQFEEPLTVLCGPNGAGKTQLLRMTQIALTDGGANSGGKYKIDASMPPCSPGEVMYLAPGWELTGGGEVPMWQAHQSSLERIRQLRKERSRHASEVLRRVKERMGPRFDGASDEEILRELMPHEAASSDEWHHQAVAEVFGKMFVSYHLHELDALDHKRPASDVVRKYGPPPWDLMNEFLTECGSPFQVRAPKGVIDPYRFQVHDGTRGLSLPPHVLSSGEQTLLSLAFWLYGATCEGVFPRVLLLDETDAHLHPAAVPGFLSVLRTVLVRKHGCAVILSTHRPDTIASAAGHEVHLVSSSTPRLARAPRKSVAVTGLTSNLFNLIPAIRVFLVEDSDDQDFYEVVFRVSKNAVADLPLVAPIFRACTVGTGRGRSAGGRGIVRGWVRKFSGTDLASLFQGIVDGDDGNQPEPGVHVLPRYSFENFLVDPLVVAAALVEVNLPPDLSSTRDLRPGQSAQIALMTSEELQSIADWVLSRLTPPSAASLQARTISYGRERQISVPDWVLTSRGKNLLGSAIEAFNHKVQQDTLRQSLERLQLVPSDLVQFVRAALDAA